MRLFATASQTVGPFFTIGLNPLARNNLVPSGAAGKLCTIRGRILDGDGVPVPDGMIETWQANAAGEYVRAEISAPSSRATEFTGFGRISTDERGAFQFTTILPGPIPAPGGGVQAPHIAVLVFARGLLRHLVTRIYFPDEPANAADPILKMVPPGRRSTLIARKISESSDILECDVVLQGEAETVFFEA
ncbi:MAG TPA: protocatechuate 3,4-dioxygenase subunit alpha [Candidatus Sulfotelmatobacter sp.]|nr:protocatechuate 3,4-dioxygenase subunit alpha [Candidatus Sulfotelmatobacter sp.]